MSCTAAAASSGKNPIRFTIAYKADELFPHLSLVNYVNANHLKKNPMAMNNTGVVLHTLGLPGRSVKAYRDAADAGVVLAATNLAHRYVEQGFWDEAKEILSKVTPSTEHDTAKVARASVAISDAQEKEQKAFEKARKDGEIAQKFLRAFADAALNEQREPLDGTAWSWGASTFEMTELGDKITAAWETSEGTYSLRGTRRNNSINISIYHNSKRITILTASEDTLTGEGLAYIKDNRLHLHA